MKERVSKSIGCIVWIIVAIVIYIILGNGIYAYWCLLAIMAIIAIIALVFIKN